MASKNDEIERAIAAAMKNYRIPGLAAGIFKNERVVFAKGYGVASLELGTPISLDMPFRIGSISKSFTAAAILMLAEKGKLRLDDSIAKFFSNAPAAWRSITVEDLLAHRSGIADYSNKKFSKQGGIFDLRQDFKESELARRSYRLPIEFNPGKKFSYSNTNYMLLGFIIRKITGEFYYRFIKKSILAPLGMNSAAVYNHSEIVNGRPSGYEFSAGRIANARFVSDTFNNTADGALYCNIFDMAKWFSALYNHKVLSKNSVDQMLSIKTPIRGSNYGYGYGWFVRENKTGKVAEHTGSWGGFTAVIKMDFASKTAVAVFTNISRGSSRWLLDEASKILGLAEAGKC
ncbi:MAG: serine hydrolase domain-containing protein [Candidatus Micrarchaeia archaeon]